MRDLGPRIGRGGNSGDAAGLVLLGGSALVLLVAVVGWVALRVSAVADGRAGPPLEPSAFARAARAGQLRWDSTATLAAAVLSGVLLAAVAVIAVRVGRARTARARCDHAAAHLARPVDLRPLRARARTGQACRLGLPAELAETHPGLPVGSALLPPHGARTAPVFASWEDTAVIVAGPRTGKSTAFAIPMLLAAPGAALATSNKRDVLDATAALRADHGMVWTFDPQRITGSASTAPWWWDPLSFLADPHTSRLDPARAGQLAAQFAASTTTAGARADAYFDTAKTDLLAALLLAAAAGGRPVTAVWSWLCDPDDTTPVEALSAAGFARHAESLHAAAHLPDRQRDGVYGSARTVMGFLLDDATTAWITPDPARPAFDPRAFATSTDTLYLLSRDSSGGAAPLVAALTVAVTDALEHHATTRPGGRLSVPFVAVLDEAANICRIRDLDSLYSHYGSRGICLVTILQNWAQGAAAWGPAGMEKLWSAANVRLYAGGVDDETFLRRLSVLVGEHRRVQQSRTRTRDGHTRTRTLVRETTLTPADLRELPAGRAVAFVSNTPAFLLATRPWWDGPHAETIRATLASGTTTGTVPAARTTTAVGEVVVR